MPLDIDLASGKDRMSSERICFQAVLFQSDANYTAPYLTPKTGSIYIQHAEGILSDFQMT